MRPPNRPLPKFEEPECCTPRPRQPTVLRGFGRKSVQVDSAKNGDARHGAETENRQEKKKVAKREEESGSVAIRRDTNSDGRRTGVIKSFNAALRMGKITCTETQSDIAINEDELGVFGVGENVTFVISN